MGNADDLLPARASTDHTTGGVLFWKSASPGTQKPRSSGQRLITLTGALRSDYGALTLASVARALPLPTFFPDRYKRMNRFIDDCLFGSQGLAEGLFTLVWGWVSTQTALPVILDQSTIGTAQLLLAGMPQAGRILPLALWVFTCQDIQNQPERTLKLQE